MTSCEVQANPDTVTGIMIIFGTLARVIFDTGSNRSFVSIMLGEQILRTLVFKGYEIVVGRIVLKANLIPLKMFDFDVILGMDWLLNH